MGSAPRHAGRPEAATGKNPAVSAGAAVPAFCNGAAPPLRPALPFRPVCFESASEECDESGYAEVVSAGRYEHLAASSLQDVVGLCEGLSLRQCGTIGAITAGKVIEVVGTTFGEDAWKDIYRLVSKVKHEKYLF